MLYATHVRIHLDHIRQNILNIRKAVGTRKLLVAVKANAYGHGAIEVSRLSEMAGVDWLGVATVPEGLQLREAGIGLPILKFSPSFREEMEMALVRNITLTIASFGEVEALQSALLATGKKNCQVHLKVDTGMGRVGVARNEAPALALRIEQYCPGAQVEGIFTHLPASDEADSTFTKTQIADFKTVAADVEGALGRKVALKHCSNSGAVLGHPEAWLDMVRPGVMIYGYYPGAETPRSIPLKPGLSMYSRVSFLKKVRKGTTIGYGRTWAAPEDTWIATIPVGYADGYNRLFSNSGRVLIRGQSFPVVGRVCMDQSMIDLGSETDVNVGDAVVLMGRCGDLEIDCYEWAAKLGTITYEVTCQISGRVARVYENLLPIC